MGYQLSIDQIFGASITDRASFAVVDNTLVYTASGGVVVCTVRECNVVSQRFFCANYILKSSGGMATSQYDFGLDKFGFPRLAQPIAIVSSSSSSSPSGSAGPGQTGLASGGISGSNAKLGARYGDDSYSGVCNHSSYSGNSNNNNVNSSLSFNNSLISRSGSRFRDRVRMVSCVAVSPNKKLLAVGETGYQPRVLVYSLAEDSNDYPLAFIGEHTFGLNCLAFSEDGRYLASLGVSTDAYLNIWKIHKGTSGHFDIHLVGTNRCTSTVNNMFWHKSLLITFGLRHIRVWHLERGLVDDSSAHYGKSLSVIKGKNALLGNMINENFIDGAVPEKLNNVYFLTDSSILCSLNLTQEKLLIEPLFKFEEPTSFFLLDLAQDRLWYAPKGSENDLHHRAGSELKNVPLKSIKFSEVQNSRLFPESNGHGNQQMRNVPSGALSGASANSSDVERLDILQIRPLNGSKRLICFSASEINVYQTDTKETVKLIEPLFKHICGVKRNEAQRELLFWSEYGDFATLSKETFTISHKGTISLMAGDLHLIENKLTAMDISDNNECFFGDRLGFLLIKSLNSKTYSYYAKIHESAINDITHLSLGNFLFVITVSRDRTIQILFKCAPNSSSHDAENAEMREWDLLQTLTMHKANITQVLTHENKFYVCSADRSVTAHCININESNGLPQITFEKSINTRATPIKIEIAMEKSTSSNSQAKRTVVGTSNSTDHLVVSTSDKLLLIYNLKTLEPIRSLKLYNELNSSLTLENYVILRGLNMIICTCSDKSVRSFSYNTGKPLTTNWGHSGLIVGLELLCQSADSCDDAPKHLVSLSNDGCLFRWQLKSDNASADNPLNLASARVGSPVKKDGQVLDASRLLTAKVQRRIVRSKSVQNLRVSSAGKSLSGASGSLAADFKDPTKCYRGLLGLNPSHSSSPLSLKHQNANNLTSPSVSRKPSVPTLRPFRSAKKVEVEKVKLPYADRLHKSSILTSLSSFLAPPSTSTATARERSPETKLFDDLVAGLRSVRKLFALHAKPEVPEKDFLLLSQELQLTAQALESRLTLNGSPSKNKQDIRDSIQNAGHDVSPINVMETLLEKYSDELVRIVQQKLQGANAR